MTFKKLALIAGLLGCTVLSVGAAAWGGGGQEMKDKDAGHPVADVQLIASVEKERFAVNEPVVLKLTLKNVGAEERRLIARDGTKDYKIEVKGEHGRVPALTRKGEDSKNSDRFSISSGRFVLTPSQERSDEISISDLFDLTTPGTYFITVTRPGPVVDGKSGRLESNKVTVIIE